MTCAAYEEGGLVTTEQSCE